MTIAHHCKVVSFKEVAKKASLFCFDASHASDQLYQISIQTDLSAITRLRRQSISSKEALSVCVFLLRSCVPFGLSWPVG
jgi:hypothetical protein